MHFDFFFDTLEAAVGPLRNTPLTTMYICSYELRGVVWTPMFLDEFTVCVRYRRFLGLLC